jgi:hypothetical protein
MLFPYVKKHNVMTMNDTQCESGLRFLSNGKCMCITRKTNFPRNKIKDITYEHISKMFSNMLPMIGMTKKVKIHWINSYIANTLKKTK